MPIVNYTVSSGYVPQMLDVGSNGSGSLTITNGGSITANDLMVGCGAE